MTCNRDATIPTLENEMPGTNELYIAVLPLIHLSVNYGLAEQTLTLFPDRNFATAFLPAEVDGYILAFESRAKKYRVGGIHRMTVVSHVQLFLYLSVEKAASVSPLVLWLVLT
jgi:hypothetical protein